MRLALTRQVMPRVGAALHRVDELAATIRPAPDQPLPERPGFCIAAIAHWRVAERERYLLDTVRSLSEQASEVAIAISTNDGAGLADALRDVADPVRVFDSLPAAAEFLLESRRGIACLDWSPHRRTHPFRLTWHHKALFRELVLHRRAFARGVTHLVYAEDDLRLAPDALGYWTDARPVLAPHGLIPGFCRFEGPADDPVFTDQQRTLELRNVPRIDLPVSRESDAPVVAWVNVPRPYQAMYILDAPLARRHLTTSRFRSPTRSYRTPTIGRGWDIRVRAAAGPMLDDTPSGFLATAVIPITREDDVLMPYRPARIEHLPANYYADATNGLGSLSLRSGFIDTTQ